MIRQIAISWLLAAASLGAQAQSVTLTHVHGLASSADGRQLMLPSHHGLAVYRDGKWSKAPGPPHDYMGFAATAKYLYSSGHPAPGFGHTIRNAIAFLRPLISLARLVDACFQDPRYFPDGPRT